MKDNEKENLNNMEKNNTNSMDEKVHYEIKFVETEDGYRLEASGDKEALKRLGIGPNMVGRKRRPGRGRRSRQWRRMNRRQRRQAAMGQRFNRMNQPWAAAGFDQPGQGRPGPGFGPRRRFHGSPCTRHDANGYGRYPGKDMPQAGEEHADTLDW